MIKKIRKGFNNFVFVPEIAQEKNIKIKDIVKTKKEKAPKKQEVKTSEVYKVFYTQEDDELTGTFINEKNIVDGQGKAFGCSGQKMLSRDYSATPTYVNHDGDTLKIRKAKVVYLYEDTCEEDVAYVMFDTNHGNFVKEYPVTFTF